MQQLETAKGQGKKTPWTLAFYGILPKGCLDILKDNIFIDSFAFRHF